MTKKSAELLIAMRKRRGFTQGKLSRKAGIGYGTISKLENGIIELSPTWARRLAKALNCQPYELIDDIGLEEVGIIVTGLNDQAAALLKEHYKLMLAQHQKK